MPEAVRELTGLEKASVLLMSLGASVSAKVFEQLTPPERELLGAQIFETAPRGHSGWAECR